MTPVRVLIYSPDLSGHRQVYCDVITDILLELGAEVVLAIGGTTCGDLKKWKYVSHFTANPHVDIVDCCQFSSKQSNLLVVEEIISFQKQHKIDVTLFADADHNRSELWRIGVGDAPRLMGRNIGIFGWTSGWYPMEDIWTGAKKELTWRQKLGKLKRQVFQQQPRNSKEFFFQEVIGRRKVLDIALVKDERVANDIGYPFLWFPDIYKSFNVEETQDDQVEYESISVKYCDFLAKHSGYEVLLYFGKAQGYKGYDLMLKLAEMDDSACFVHCGELYAEGRGEPDAQSIRSKLSAQGRLFETQQYIHSQRLIDLFFSSTSRMVSTHRLTGSSGVMLQALDAGKPILVPNAGLLGYRMKGNNLGLTYEHGNIQDLFQQWKIFKRIPTDDYAESINAYMKMYSRESLTKLIKQCCFS